MHVVICHNFETSHLKYYYDTYWCMMTLLIYLTASVLDLVTHCPSHCLEACHHTVLLPGNLPAECPLLKQVTHTHTHHKTSSVVKECM